MIRLISGRIISHLLDNEEFGDISSTRRLCMQIQDLNKAAWDHAVDKGTNPYTQVVSAEQVAEAKQGKWSLYLSDCIPVPKDWFLELEGRQILCLASGGGQQAPIFAAMKIADLKRMAILFATTCPAILSLEPRN